MTNPPSNTASNVALLMAERARFESWLAALEARRDHGADGYVDAVVISHELWRRRYGADPSIVGRHTPSALAHAASE